jgi:hypothetical protein
MNAPPLEGLSKLLRAWSDGSQGALDDAMNALARLSPRKVQLL